MSLNKLEKKLYDPDSGIEKRKHEESQFDPLSSIEKNEDVLKKEKPWEKFEDTGKAERFKVFKMGAIALASIALISIFIVAYVKFRQSAFGEENVSVRIEGPLQASSSQNVKYKISFSNNNRVDIENVQILLDYSENFKPKENQNIKIENPSRGRINIGTVKGHSSGEVEINGVFFAAKDTTIYLNAALEYKPSNFNATYQAKKQLGINIDSSPLFLEIQAPLEVASGNKVDYVIDFRNSSTEYFDNVRIRVEYPDGFSFVSSQPASSEGENVWYLGSLNPNQSGKVVISGSMNGSGDEGKILKIYLGHLGEKGDFIVYDQKEKMTKIISTMLSISQSINGQSSLNVNPGDQLEYVIQYKNNGNIGLKDVIVTEEIDSRILDFSKLNLGKGSYDASGKKITWRAAEIPGLANLSPGEGGKISFSIPILDRIPVENENDKNFTIVSTAKIDSPSIPTSIGANKIIASNRMELKLNSRIILDVKGYYKDENIENYGPIPPKVGQETSYVIHWKIINISNDVSNVKVVSYLPSGIKWKEKIYPEQEAVTFNERTNQIEWEAGSLKNGVGILNPAKEVSFQISTVPQINQLKKDLILLNPSILTANDLFTNIVSKFEVGEKSNKLSEDSSIGEKYQVAE